MLKVTLRFFSVFSVIFFIVIMSVIGMSGFAITPRVLQLLDVLICTSNPCSSVATDEDVSMAYDNILSSLATGNDGSIQLDAYTVTGWISLDKTRTFFTAEAMSERNRILLGDIITHYGDPCSITIGDSAIIFEYPDFLARTTATYDLPNTATWSTHISAYMPIQNMTLTSNMQACDKPPLFPVSYNIIAQWYGFRSLRFYACKQPNRSSFSALC